LIVKLISFALVGALSLFLLREFGWRGAPVFCAVAALGALSFILPYFKTVREVFGDYAESYGLSTVSRAVLKVVGIGYLGGITADVCTDLCAGSIANAVVTVTRLEILLVAVPYFVEILRLGVSLIE